MPRRTLGGIMRDRNPDWPSLFFESWMLAGEMTLVIWLRSARLMAGGPRAIREANRMMTEKAAAHAALLPHLLAGGLEQGPEALTARTLDHYGKPVHANLRRLSRRRR